MNSKLTIRNAFIEDAEMVSKLIGELFLELGHKPPVADFTQLVTLCKDVLKKDECAIFLSTNPKGYADGIITVSEGVSIYAGGRFGVIREFYVVPEMRSRGVGKALLEKAKEFSLNKGWKRIEVSLPSQDEHIRTYNFYTREGFREIGPRLKYENLYK
jgi:GNAT superfamily N-acetyltransferase